MSTRSVFHWAALRAVPLRVLLAVALAATAWVEPASAEDTRENATAEPAPAANDDLLLWEDDPLLDLEFEELPNYPDPWESANRKIFAFNRQVDRWAWTPVTKTYQFFFPEFARRGIHNFFLNLGEPVVLVNQLLQLRFRDGAVTVGRLVLNSTAGIGGLFDAAGRGAGWGQRREDFGQTLAVWGVSSGPYVIIPVFGPSTVRDAAGSIVDRAMDPVTFFVGPLEWIVVLGAGEGISLRDAHARDLKELEKMSVDFYSALRNVYFQVRMAEIANNAAKD
ncbi:VacJ family lipoprotein [Myxococcota bacterium]|nr:VacJ family lipoprotein [Myxococcota bacterium]